MRLQAGRAATRTALTAGLLVLPLRLASQSPADRTALAALRDTLPAVSDSLGLRQLSKWEGDANTRRLREALVLLRIGTLGSRRNPYDDALRKAESAIDFRSRWPWGWYTLGLIDLAMAEQRFPYKASAYNLIGFTYRESGIVAMAQSVQADTTFEPAVSALTQLVLVLGHSLLPDVAAPVLRRAAYVEGAPANASLALHRLEMQAGNYEAALRAAREYIRRGGDVAIGRLEEARALRGVGQSEDAVAAYYAGLHDPTPDGRTEYRNDLAWVAADWEIAEFDTLSHPGLTSWVERFWGQRDVLALRSQGERLAEHLRRWDYAHRNYLMHRSPDSPHSYAGGLTDADQEDFNNFDAVSAMVLNDLGGAFSAYKGYRRQQWEIDDRGVIYLRHGQPTRVSFYPGGPPNESWQYDIPEGSRIFHFLGSRALGTQAATTLVAALPLTPGMLDARGNLDPRYTAMASDLEARMAQVKGTQGQNQNHPVNLSGLWDGRRGSAGSSIKIGEQGAFGVSAQFRPEVAYKEIRRGRDAIAAGVTTDAFPRTFKRDLGAITQVYGVGLRPGEPPRILLTFAVPGRNLSPGDRGDGGAGIAYPVSIRVIAMDRTQGIIRQLDTTRLFVARDTLRGEQHLAGLLELPVPPGSYQVRMLVSSPGLDAASGQGRDSVEVPAPNQPLFLSDLVLGREGSGLSWQYGGRAVALNPLNAFPHGTDAELFYELGGLTSGARYQVTTSVRRAPADPKEKPALQIAFDLEPLAAYQQVTRGIGLANLKPGSYLLEVTVKEAGTTRQVTRRRSLNILEN